MSIDQVSFVRLRDVAMEILQSWLREWSLLARDGIAKIWPVEDGLAVVMFGDSEIVLRRSAAANDFRIPLDGEMPGPSPLLTLAHGTGGATRIALAFSDAEVLRLSVRLPKAKPSVLRKALHFELARLSPLPPEALYFDFESQSLPEKGEAEIRLRVIRRAVVDRALAKCRAAGLKVAMIKLGRDLRPADWRAFPIDRDALLLALWQRFQLIGLGALAAALGLLLLVALYARGNATAASLSRQIETAQLRATAIEHLHGRMERLVQEQSFLALQKEKPLLTATIADVSRLLPNDTWITDLQVTGNKLRLQGYSTTSSHLTGEIGSSRNFRKVQFEAPVTQDSTTGASRFDLSSEVAR